WLTLARFPVTSSTLCLIAARLLISPWVNTRGWPHIIGATLRRLGEIDAIIKARLDRPISSRHTRIRNILRIGVAELVFLETPPHAAVDAAVRVATQHRKGALKGLVNAILRRLDRDQKTDTPITNPTNPGEAKTPNWLFHRW
ncbi:unnamed protein product, partial [Laminaria digitata]